jgi:hypothetical protein
MCSLFQAVMIWEEREPWIDLNIEMSKILPPYMMKNPKLTNP